MSKIWNKDRNPGNHLRTPDEPEDDSKFVFGGCCISDQDPTSTCVECGWEGDYEDHARVFRG